MVTDHFSLNLEARKYIFKDTNSFPQVLSSALVDENEKKKMLSKLPIHLTERVDHILEREQRDECK
jgi:hypothetical protein